MSLEDRNSLRNKYQRLESKSDSLLMSQNSWPWHRILVPNFSSVTSLQISIPRLCHHSRHCTHSLPICKQDTIIRQQQQFKLKAAAEASKRPLKEHWFPVTRNTPSPLPRVTVLAPPTQKNAPQLWTHLPASYPLPPFFLWP